MYYGYTFTSSSLVHVSYMYILKYIFNIFNVIIFSTLHSNKFTILNDNNLLVLRNGLFIKLFMFLLFVINENFTTGYKDIFLDSFSIIAVLCGIFVIVSKNPIVSILFLIGLFLSISIYLILLGMNFIGLSYLLVYIGAVSILFLFILMLINIRISELLNESSNSIPLAAIIGVYFNYCVYEILPYNTTFSANLTNISNTYLYGNNSVILNNIFSDNISNNAFFVSSALWDGSLIETTHITSIGNIMYTSHSIWLILTSMILLLAMVGAIVITIKQNKN